MTPSQRQFYENDPFTPEATEREKLLSGGGSTSDLSADELLQPQSDTQMRNRYLARIGAEVTDSNQQM